MLEKANDADSQKFLAELKGESESWRQQTGLRDYSVNHHDYAV